MTARRCVGAIAIAWLASVVLVACDGDRRDQGSTGSHTATESESSVAESKPKPRAHVCFTAGALQVFGGKSLAALDQAEEGTGPPVRVNLDSVVAQVFAPSLRLELGRLRRSGGRPGPVVAAAHRALGSVVEDPNLLLRERTLTKTFAKAQRRAEAGGYSSPQCDA
jgi:hypothetical protein